MSPLHTKITPATTVDIDGKELLFFSGFSYLGLHAHPLFKEALKEGIDKYGTVFISSRIANVQLTLYDELEVILAGKHEAAVTFSSGYMASQAAIQYAKDKGIVLSAPNTHPSLQLGQVIPKISWQEWTDQTIAQVNTNDNDFVIVADSVNPLTSTINDFSWLKDIQKQVLILIDDSHGIGIIESTLPQQPNLDYLISASLAKAYSTQGGVIKGKAVHIDKIKQQPIFTAGTPLMPANAHAFLKSRELHQAQRTRLHQNISNFKQRTKIHNPFSLPVFLLQGVSAQYLLDNKVVISSFGYPHPDSPTINRIIITAAHTDAQLQFLHELLKNNPVQ
jgi:7-keto-8-aminopelargonate synthetase-like enzyme